MMLYFVHVYLFYQSLIPLKVILLFYKLTSGNVFSNHVTSHKEQCECLLPSKMAPLHHVYIFDLDQSSLYF